MPGVPHGSKRPRRKIVRRHTVPLAKPRKTKKQPPATPSYGGGGGGRVRSVPSGGLRVKQRPNKKPKSQKPKYKMVKQYTHRPTEEEAAGNSQSSSNYNVRNTTVKMIKKRIEKKKKKKKT